MQKMLQFGDTYYSNGSAFPYPFDLILLSEYFTDLSVKNSQCFA